MPTRREPLEDYEAAIAWLLAFADFERGSAPRRSAPAFALDRIRSLLARLGEPQHGRITIHVAGSKGKGSTAAMLESILRAAGLRTGLFTSPHLHDFTERIRILGAPLPQFEFARLCEDLRLIANAELAEAAAADEEIHISTFELLTALAFHAFQTHNVEVQIVEVGLGGRLDSTNVFARTDAAVITALSHEHTDILGDQITQIAAEKAGIITAACRTAILAPQRFAAAAAVVRNAADDVPAPLVDVGAAYASEAAGVEAWGQWFALERKQPRPGEAARQLFLLPLLGRHQIDNAATAVAAIDALNANGAAAVSSEAVHKGLATVAWPGRLELFPLPTADGERRVVVDGAHNPESVQRALAACAEYWPHRQLHVIFGALGDKALGQMASLIQARSRHLYATSSDHPRARPAPQIAAAFQTEEAGEWNGAVEVWETPAAALSAAAAQAEAEDLILVLGSLSLAADARRVLTELQAPVDQPAPRRAEDPTT